MSTPQSASPPAATSPAAPAFARESRTMDLELHGAADVAFPLFGPVREREWSPEWSPQFLAPAAPAQGPDGAVFTTEGTGTAPSVWVMTDFDAAARLVRYVNFQPGVAVGELSVRVTPAGASASTAEVTYRFTAVSADGNDFIARWVAHFPHMAPHWEGALNARLAALGGKP